MTPQTFVAAAVAPALALLGPQYRSREAMAMLVAIGLQESGLRARHQYGNGPAHGLLQFELIGCRGVLEHPASAAAARRLCDDLLYTPDPLEVYDAIEYADVLAAGFARLALWRLPDPLPGRDGEAQAWAQYLEAWRPGRPKPEPWAGHYAGAWAAVEAWA